MKVLLPYAKFNINPNSRCVLKNRESVRVLRSREPRDFFASLFATRKIKCSYFSGENCSFSFGESAAMFLEASACFSSSVRSLKCTLSVMVPFISNPTGIPGNLTLVL